MEGEFVTLVLDEDNACIAILYHFVFVKIKKA